MIVLGISASFITCATLFAIALLTRMDMPNKALLRVL